MGAFSTFDIAGSALSAQSLRLNLDREQSREHAQRRRRPGRRLSRPARALSGGGRSVRAACSPASTCSASSKATAPPIERYDPGHPQANEQGLVYAANVNAMEEMANMISASRSYQSNLEVLNTAKDLLLRTLSLGQG